MFAPLKVRVTNSGRGNSANSTVNNFGVDAYTTTNSAGALVRKDMHAASCIRKMGELPLTQGEIRGDIFQNFSRQKSLVLQTLALRVTALKISCK